MLVLGAPICLCFCDRLSVCGREWSGIDDLPGGRVNVCLSVSRRRRQFMQTPCPYPIQEHPWLTDSSPKLLKLSNRPRHRPQPPLTGTRHIRYFAPPEYVKFPLWTVSLSLTAWLPPTPTATPAPPSALPCPARPLYLCMQAYACVSMHVCLWKMQSHRRDADTETDTNTDIDADADADAAVPGRAQAQVSVPSDLA